MDISARAISLAARPWCRFQSRSLHRGSWSGRALQEKFVDLIMAMILATTLQLTVPASWQSSRQVSVPNTQSAGPALADIDADCSDCGDLVLRHGVLLVFGAPGQLLSLAGQEHGRTIPLATLRRRQLTQCEGTTGDHWVANLSVFFNHLTLQFGSIPGHCAHADAVRRKSKKCAALDASRGSRDL